MGAAALPIAVGATLIGAISSADAQSKAGAYSQSVANSNAAMADRASADAIARGDVAANMLRYHSAKLEGEQRTAYGSSGVDLQSGSAIDVMTGSKLMGERDAMVLRNNAAREAWGYKVQGENFRTQGRFDQQKGDYGAAGTLLGTTATLAKFLG